MLPLLTAVLRCLDGNARGARRGRYADRPDRGPGPSVFTRSWRLARRESGHRDQVDGYAVGFARPDRWTSGGPSVPARPWHAVEVHRPPAELDGEVELALCGAIVQIWGSQTWERIGAGRTACAECRRISAVQTPRACGR
jgi:hypothetical protein